ncbi:putative invertase inhibitor [Nymphaea thermarum]|nr:putative invertase inhibitor [Nymphaea thermarum]
MKKRRNADSRSHHAKLTGLDVIAMELSIKNATSTLSYISKLLKQKTDPYTKGCLKDCNLCYSITIDQFKFAIEDFGDKRYDNVNMKISAAMTNTDTCDVEFTDGERASPLTKQNLNLMKLGNLALDILALIAEP